MAAQVLAEEGKANLLAKVDVDANSELKTRFKIQTYPTLLWFV
jgi:thioredoxin-like negative regulator of GroEL